MLSVTSSSSVSAGNPLSAESRCEIERETDSLQCAEGVRSEQVVQRAFPTAARSLARKYTLTQTTLAKLQPNIVRVGRYELILAKCK
jgi:hypothetical protein